MKKPIRTQSKSSQMATVQPKDLKNVAGGTYIPPQQTKEHVLL